MDMQVLDFELVHQQKKSFEGAFLCFLVLVVLTLPTPFPHTHTQPHRDARARRAAAARLVNVCSLKTLLHRQ